MGQTDSPRSSDSPSPQWTPSLYPRKERNTMTKMRTTMFMLCMTVCHAESIRSVLEKYTTYCPNTDYKCPYNLTLIMKCPCRNDSNPMPLLRCGTSWKQCTKSPKWKKTFRKGIWNAYLPKVHLYQNSKTRIWGIEMRFVTGLSVKRLNMHPWMGNTDFYNFSFSRLTGVLSLDSRSFHTRVDRKSAPNA